MGVASSPSFRVVTLIWTLRSVQRDIKFINCGMVQIPVPKHDYGLYMHDLYIPRFKVKFSSLRQRSIRCRKDVSNLSTKYGELLRQEGTGRDIVRNNQSQLQQS